MQISRIVFKIQTVRLIGTLCAVCIGYNAAADVWLPSNCVRAVEHTFCRDPVHMGPDDPDCRQVDKVSDCMECEPCYALDERYGFDYINNETGETLRTSGCAPIEFTTVPGRTGYLYRKCHGSDTFEYSCDLWYSNTRHYYPNGKEIKCNSTEKSDGTFSFSLCTGCTLCDEATERWQLVSGAEGYEQIYKNRFVAIAGSYCTAVGQGSYRCTRGYYGSPTSSTSGCNKCPTLAESGITLVANPLNITVVTSPVGSTQKTDCYARTGDTDERVTLSDGVGTFEWDYDDAIQTEGICHYSE